MKSTLRTDATQEDRQFRMLEMTLAIAAHVIFSVSMLVLSVLR